MHKLFDFFSLLALTKSTWDGIERRHYDGSENNLVKARELTARLTDTIKEHKNGIDILSSTGGRLINYILYSNQNLGICRFKAEKGAIHDKHYHPMNEWIGIESGKLIAHLPDGDKIVSKYEILMIPKDTPHLMEYPEETEGWAITMPKDEGF